MRKSRQHGPRGDFRGARRERSRQGGGPGGGRKRNRRRSEHPEEDRQGPPQTRGPRRERSRQAYGKSEHRPPQNRRDRRRSEYPEGEGHGPPRVRGPRRERPRQAYGKSEHRPPQNRRDRRRSEYPEGEGHGPPQARGPQRERPRQAYGKSEHRPPQNRRDHRRSPQVNFTQDHPMKDLYTLHDRMGHVLGRMAAFREEKPQKGKSDWNPSLDFFETEDRFEVLVELPGISQDDVNVSVTENQLVIKGKKQKEQTDETQNLHHSERRYGKFHRVFPLPPNAVPDDIKAEFKDGVLKLVIPKTDAAKPTEIPISGDA